MKATAVVAVVVVEAVVVSEAEIDLVVMIGRFVDAIYTSIE
jgi:hypothetical protein